ncbi:hypothetical protein [Nevskia ramosa]|uniref:hypothetical protein n=1 Tax=Nevskia ramosa TaxID=64002 RepID=UPI0003B3E19D|nr:hypothetical protein [Nevskia ramosa]
MHPATAAPGASRRAAITLKPSISYWRELSVWIVSPAVNADRCPSTEIAAQLAIDASRLGCKAAVTSSESS